MNDKIKKVIKYILSAVLAAVLLWFSFRDVQWADFIEGLKGCRWGYVLLSMAAGAFAFWLRALRWRQLLHPVDDSISRTTTFNGINIGNISNFVFPRIGEFVRCGVITRRSQPVDPEHPEHKKASYDKVLGTVVLERGWELLVMLLLLVVVLIGGADRFGAFFMERIWEPMVQRFDALPMFPQLEVLMDEKLLVALVGAAMESVGIGDKVHSSWRDRPELVDYHGYDIGSSCAATSQVNEKIYF